MPRWLELSMSLLFTALIQMYWARKIIPSLVKLNPRPLGSESSAIFTRPLLLAHKTKSSFLKFLRKRFIYLKCRWLHLREVSSFERFCCNIFMKWKQNNECFNKNGSRELWRWIYALGKPPIKNEWQIKENFTA